MLNSLLKFAPVQVFSSLSVFLLIAIQTRYLAVEKYGLLAIFMVVIELFRACTSQWLSTSLLRLYPSAEIDERKMQATTALYLIYGLWLLSCVALVVFLFLYKQLKIDIAIALAGLLLTKSIYLYFVDLARLNENVTVYRKAVITQSVMALVLTVFFLTYQSHVSSAIYALIGSYLLGMLWLYKQKGYGIFSKKIAITFIKYGGPLLLAGFLTTLRTSLDRIFISDFIGLFETGIYAALSSMLLGVTSLVFMIIAMPLYPELSRLSKQAYELKLAHGKYLDMLMGVALPSLIGLCFISEPLTETFLSKEYVYSGQGLFYIIAISAFILNIKGHYIDHGLQFLLKTKYLTLISTITLSVNVFLVLTLIKPFGIYAAAWANLVANLIALIISAAIAIKNGYHYSLGSNFFKVILASLAMFITLALGYMAITVNNSIVYLACLIVIGALSYLTAILLTNAFGFRGKIMKRLSK